MMRDEGGDLSVCVALLAPKVGAERWTLTIGDLVVSGIPLPALALTDSFLAHRQAALVLPADVVRRYAGKDNTIHVTFFITPGEHVGERVL